MSLRKTTLSRVLEMQSVSERWENLDLISAQCEALQLLAIEKSKGKALPLCKAPSQKVLAAAASYGVFYKAT